MAEETESEDELNEEQLNAFEDLVNQVAIQPYIALQDHQAQLAQQQAQAEEEVAQAQGRPRMFARRTGPRVDDETLERHREEEERERERERQREIEIAGVVRQLGDWYGGIHTDLQEYLQLARMSGDLDFVNHLRNEIRQARQMLINAQRGGAIPQMFIPAIQQLFQQMQTLDEYINEVEQSFDDEI